jgi:hypothetical protein
LYNKLQFVDFLAKSFNKLKFAVPFYKGAGLITRAFFAFKAKLIFSDLSLANRFV